MFFFLFYFDWLFVSLFNGISTDASDLISKSSLEKNSSVTI